MPGTIIFKPLEANLHREKETVFQIDPYCKFTLGWHSAQSTVGKGHDHAKWDSQVSLARKHNEYFAKLVVKDSDSFTLDELLGEAQIDLEPVLEKGKTSEWYQVVKHGKVMGEILLEMEYKA